MDFTPRETDPEVARRYLAEGFWGTDSLGALLASGLSDAAANPFTVRSERMPYRGTLGDVDALARRVATGLRARGIGPGDPVAFQLPNWLEAAATFYAIAYLGAVVVPIVHFYGPKEVGYILRKTRVKALITADRFGHQDFVANLAGMRDTLTDLEWVAIVGDRTGDAVDPRDIAFDDLVAGEALADIPKVDPKAPALVAYTSGTTSDPKGVVHSHRTINAEIHQLSAMQADRGGPPTITGAPVGHGIGMLAALLIPVYRRSEIHLIDVWDPGRVLQAMLDDGAVGRAGIDLLPHEPPRPPRLRRSAPCAAHAVHRSRWIGGTGRGGRAVRGDGHRDRAQLRFHRAPFDHGLHPRRAARQAREH